MNRKIVVKIFILLGLYLVSFSSFGQEGKDKLSAKWMMLKVIDAGKDVTQKHNPKQNRWIEFKSDGSFKSDGDPFGPNAGTWKLNQEKGILYIDSDVDNDDSEWHVTFVRDEMIWTGIGDPRKEGFKLIYQQEKP